MHCLRSAIFIAIIAATVAKAQELNGFGMWKASDLKAIEAQLDHEIRPDHSARRTLGDYGNHRVRLIHRVGTGAPEFHSNFADLWIVESGQGTLVVGGTLVDAQPLSGEETLPGDMTGTSIKGGDRRQMAAGDIVHVPPNTPHQAIVPTGGQITYIRVAIPVR